MTVLFLRSNGEGFAGEGKRLYSDKTFLQVSVHDWHKRVPRKLLVASHSDNQPLSPPC